MEILWGAAARPSEPKPTVVTVGMFDGVHRGHALVFKRVCDEAKAIGARAAVVTFDPHPLEVLAPDKAPCALATLEQRLKHFENAGLDITLVLPFNNELASLSPDEFTQVMLVQDLHVRKVLVGEDFRFGHRRAGDVGTLRELGKQYGFEAEAIGLLANGSHRISSTDIRRLIGDGRVEEAAELLGHRFRLAGTVVAGQGLGHELHGLRTANLDPHGRACLPGIGVYAGHWVWGGKHRPGVINVGRERGPDLEPASGVVVEIHVFDFDQDIIGEQGEIEFTAFLRPEIRFTGTEELVAQIHADAARARDLLEAAT
ncbi:MAG TPA: bifunctional riboflavin kinase/FAD synthetase [Actinomycetota bacterium]|jgi:riboflavin kinase/FMN adenylyltransferase|nr:bifunctional riboflavin kinase/FAD synthetase [Actinomycetota bacterium]